MERSEPPFHAKLTGSSGLITLSSRRSSRNDLHVLRRRSANWGHCTTPPHPTAIANQMTALLRLPEPNLRLRRWTEGCVTWTIVSGPQSGRSVGLHKTLGPMERSLFTARTCSLFFGSTGRHPPWVHVA